MDRSTPLIRSFMIAGTGRGVGKTLVTASLVHAFRDNGVAAVAMKPIARGHIDRVGAWHSQEIQRLASVSAFGLPQRVLCGQWLAEGDTPNIDDAQVFERLAVASAVDTFRVLSTWADTVIVEDSHGLPVSSGSCFDGDALARQLCLPVVLVVGLEEGCDARSSRRLHQFDRRGVRCVGWIANRHPAGCLDRDLEQALLDHLPIPRLGSVGWMNPVSAERTIQGVHMDELLQALAA